LNNAGSTPTYQWWDGGTPIGTNSANLTYNVTGSSAIYCVVTYGGTGVNCPDGVPATSNTVAFNPVATPSQPSNPTGLSTVCVNQAGVTYTTSASGANTYTWTAPGGTIISGQGTGTITVNWGGTGGAFVMTVTPYNICGTAGPVRNKTITINPFVASPALTINEVTGGSTNICQYLPLDFSANITDPANLAKTAVWKVDGNTIFTASNTSAAYFIYPNAGSFNYSFVNPGTHTVTCEITFTSQPAPGQCYSPNVSISNTITYNVTANEHASVSIVSTMDTNHFCRGTLDVFTATALDAGTGSFTWYVDGVPDGSSTTNSFNYIPMAPGQHVVYCVVHSNEHCDSMPPVSNPPTFYDLDAYSNTQIVNVDPCSYYVPATGNLGPFAACGGSFYDSQTDPGANYTNNQNGTITLCSVLAGQYVSITFTSMALADATDILRIYSGTGTGGPLLQTFAGPVNTTSFCGAVVSQDATGGCLTAQFQTGSSGVAAGWVGNISCSPTTSSQPAGVNCSNPTIIAALPYTATGHSTQCFLNDYTNQSGICNATYSGEDRVYRYDAVSPECTNIIMSGTAGNPALAVYQGCPGSGGICLTATPMVGNNSMQFTFPTAGTYYIIIDETSGYSTYTLTIQSFGLAPQNDLPCNAQYVDLLVSVNGNNACTGSALEPATPGCWTTGTVNATWHYFIAPASGSVRIRTTPGSINKTQIALYSLSGSCSVSTNFTLMACNQIGPTCNAPNPLTTSSEIAASGLTPGTAYYVRVDGINSNTGNYNIIVVDQTGPQPYVAGQDCVVPLPICSPQFEIPSPGFYNTGWVCDFTTANSSCISSGELNSCWLVFNTNATGVVAWKLVPYGVNPPSTDYDWWLADITSFGSDQATRVASACTSINANSIPWVRCNLTGAAANFTPCCTDLYCTGLCPAATTNSSPGSGPSFNASINVTAGQTFLMFLMNHWQNNVGFKIDFNAFGTSPINYGMPAVAFWTGTVSTDWFNTANWGNCGPPPDCNTSAIIYSGANNYPVIPTGSTALCKGLDIRAGASVSLTGTGQIDICGNLVNNGTLSVAPTATLNLVNSSAQYFDGFMTGSSSIGNLKMSKSAAGASKLTLLDNAQVSGNLTLANTAFGGKIVTGISELYVTNNAPASVNAGSTTSYVEGNLRRNLDGTLSNSTYYFPLGHSTTGYEIATIDFTSTHSVPNILGYFTPWSSLPGPAGFTDAGACPVTYNTSPAFYNNGYWTLSASANASSANYDLQLRNQGVTNGPGTNFTVAKAATIAGPWSLSGSCTSVAYPFAKRTGMNGFSVFATAQTGNTFPISLLYFDAKEIGTEVQTSWSTETEINNNYFVVERSADGSSFAEIGRRNGAGNSSSTLYYSLIDNKPLKGISYYRLRQVDFDGVESYSDVVAVSFLEPNVLTVYPNPAQSEVQCSFNAAAAGEVIIEMIDALGKTVLSQKVKVSKGLNVITELDIQFVPRGVYIMQVKPINGEIIEPMQKRFVKKTKEE
jgi:hypothetical protein